MQPALPTLETAVHHNQVGQQLCVGMCVFRLNNRSCGPDQHAGTAAETAHVIMDFVKLENTRCHQKSL